MKFGDKVVVTMDDRGFHRIKMVISIRLRHEQGYKESMSPEFLKIIQDARKNVRDMVERFYPEFKGREFAYLCKWEKMRNPITIVSLKKRR